MVPCYRIPQPDQGQLLGIGDRVQLAVFHWVLVPVPNGDPSLSFPNLTNKSQWKLNSMFQAGNISEVHVSGGIGDAK